MKLTAYQMDIVWENAEANYKKVEKFAAIAAEKDSRVFVLPEMFPTGFTMNISVSAEERNGKTMSFLSKLSRKLEMYIIGGLTLNGEGGKGINTAVVFNDAGELVSEYAKTHLFRFAGEDINHIAGNGPSIFKIDDMTFSIQICYDLRFPEIFRKNVEKIYSYIVMASWPASRQMHWDTLLRARAIENQSYVIGVNRVGSDGNNDYTGGSVIYDSYGNVVSIAQDNNESLVIGEISVDSVKEIRNKYPFLKDRKIFHI